jgi:hypothetical protein
MHVNWSLHATLNPDVAATRLGAPPRDDPSTKGRGRAGPRSARRQAWFHYWLIFGVCFLVFYAAGFLERCNPLFWLRRPRASQRQSLWNESRATAHRCTVLAFEG